VIIVLLLLFDTCAKIGIFSDTAKEFMQKTRRDENSDYLRGSLWFSFIIFAANYQEQLPIPQIIFTMAEQYISSTQNPKIRQLLLLQQKASERRNTGRFVVEGRRELNHCINAGYEVENLFVLEGTPLPTLQSSTLSQPSASVQSTSHLQSKTPFQSATQVFIVSAHVYERIAYRGGTEGVTAIAKAREYTLADIGKQINNKNGQAPLLVILESVEKPGNLGAVLRSADAANADAVIICDPLTDLFNPNLIRASIGACFTVPVVACSSTDCIDFLRNNNIQILTAQLQDSKPYYDTNMCLPTAIVMGTESTGLTDIWRQAADTHIRIPMLGKLDSLNVSVSAAILLFEAVRQRASV